MQWSALLILIFFVITTGAVEREKRALFGIEDAYFKQYYNEKGLLDQYNAAKSSRGVISDWSTLGSTSYSSAVRASTSYYKHRAEAGVDVSTQCLRVESVVAYRIHVANQHGGPDAGHAGAINLWQSGLDQIQIGIHTYAQHHGHSVVGCK